MRTKQAVKHFGTKADVARAADVSRSAVTRWGEVVPIKRAWKLQRRSGGKISMRLGDYK
jgi:hypothetical protein